MLYFGQLSRVEWARRHCFHELGASTISSNYCDTVKPEQEVEVSDRKWLQGNPLLCFACIDLELWSSSVQVLSPFQQYLQTSL